MRTIHRDIVGGYIFSKDSKLLLGQNRKGGVYEGSFLVPAGGVEEGETKEETLKREMLEEVGIDISDAEITPFRTSFGVNKKTLDNGERVLVEMNFFDYRIDLNKNADELEVKTNSDWHNHQWFSFDELSAIKLAEPTREALTQAGIIR